MSTIDTNQILQQLRSMAALAEGKPASSSEIGGAQTTDFSNLLKASINKVNDTQQTAGQLAAAFEVGDKNVDLAQVMIALEKASLSFQALTQVRNKLVSAYQEVMNMQV